MIYSIEGTVMAFSKYITTSYYTVESHFQVQVLIKRGTGTE